MEKLDQNIMQILGTGQELELIDILARLGNDPEKVNMSLIRLRKQGVVVLENRFYKATKNSQTVKARCPECGSIRLVANPKQRMVYCPNPDCKTETGRRRTFVIYSRGKLVDGKRKRINLVE